MADTGDTGYSEIKDAGDDVKTLIDQRDGLVYELEQVRIYHNRIFEFTFKQLVFYQFNIKN